MENNYLDEVYIFEIDSSYLKEKGELLVKTLNGWLNENICNAFCSTFILGDNVGELIVDYSYDIDKKEKIKEITVELLKRFNIQFNLR